MAQVRIYYFIDPKSGTDLTYSYQFSESGADMELPSGMVEFHKKNFCHYFQLTPEEFRGKSVLETSAGPGKHAAVLHLLGTLVTAVDLLESNVQAILRLKNAHNFSNLIARRADLMEPLPEDWPEYDLISAHNWLQHTENPGTVLANLVKKLKIGGRLYLSVYQSDTFRFFIDQIARSMLKWSDREVTLRLIPFCFPTGFSEYENPDDIYFENILDDFFVPYMWTFRYESLVRFLEGLGCKPMVPLQGRENLYEIDNEPLKIGLVKTSEKGPENINLEYTIDQFDLSYIENSGDREYIANTVKWARQAIDLLRSTGEEEAYARAAFSLGLYRLREPPAGNEVSKKNTRLCRVTSRDLSPVT